MQSTGRKFEGKVAFITGSAGGIGQAVARHLARLGATVVVHDITPDAIRMFGRAESLQALAREIAEETGTKTLAVHGDVTDEQAVKRIIGEIHANLGGIDILVTSVGGNVGAGGIHSPDAGRPRPNDAVFIPWADVRAVLDLNILSTILVCREVAPEMIDRRAGCIINISSHGAFLAVEQDAIYLVAKAAVVHYTRCLAAQLRQYNVRVNTVAPGPTASPRVLVRDNLDESKMVKDGTFNRYCWPAEIAEAVEYLASDSAAFITGQALRLDGGVQLWPA